MREVLFSDVTSQLKTEIVINFLRNSFLKSLPSMFSFLSLPKTNLHRLGLLG